MQYLIIFLISFNLQASTPLYKVTDSVKAVCDCVKNGVNGTIVKIWTGESPMYLVEFSDGSTIPLDEYEITINP